MDPYTLRTTLWHTPRGDLVQVSVAVLDAAWEPEREYTLPVGPFDDQDLVVAELTARAIADAWRLVDQQTLPL